MARWPTKSSSAAALVALMATGTAQAGACCVGSVTSVPTRLGECEKVGLGLTLAGEQSTARWDRDGQLQQSSLTQQALLGTFGAGLRLDRRWQLGLSLPTRLNHVAVDPVEAWGGGPGDARVTALFDPLEERPAIDGPAAPVPLLSFGARLPTGRDWTRATGALGEDITGLEQPAAIVGASVERTLDRWPWSVGVTAEIGVGDHVQPTLTSLATLGRTLGTRWTLVGSARHQLAWASLEPDVRPVHGAHLGARVVHGQAVRWRVFLGAESGVPLSYLGSGSDLRTTVSAGALLVR